MAPAAPASRSSWLDPGAPRAIAEATLLGLGAGALLLLLLPAHADTDIWGHVRFGQELLATGSVPRTDPYSYLAGASRWINHELLSEAAFAAAFNTLGGLGLVLVKFAVVLALAFMASRRLVQVGSGRLRVLALMLPAAVLLLPRFGTVRPQIFTTLGCALLLLVLLRAELKGPKPLWALPPLIALWANTHGGVLLGVGLMLVWAVARSLEARRPVGRELLPVAVATAALLANPYGAALPLFLLRTATVPRPDVAEWQPLQLATPQGLAYLTLLALLAHGAWRGLVRIDYGRAALLLAFALLPLLATRHTDVFAIGVLLFGAGMLSVPLKEANGDERVFPAGSAADLTGSSRRRTSPPLTPPARLLAAVLCAGMLVAGADAPGCINISPKVTAFPARAVATLESAGVRANVAVPFAWGEYLIWKGYPRLRVSVDGRRETVYSQELRAAELHLETGQGDWASLLRDVRTDLVLVRRSSPTANLLAERGDWTRVYVDEAAEIFARSRSALAARIASAGSAGPIPADGRGECFR